MAKTNQYLIIFEDGTFTKRMWGGNAASLRRSLENEGYLPTGIWQWMRPLYSREGKEID